MANGVEHDSLLESERPHPPSMSSGSPAIKIHFETFEMNSSFPVDLNASINSMSLPQAVRENKLALVRQYSHMGQDLNVADWNGFTALHYAARANQVEVVMTLVECKVDINQQGRELLTPLHVAVRYNSYEAVKTLIEYGADPSMKDTDGATPLHFAARHGCVDSSKVLLSNSLSSVNFQDNSGMTPFHLACASGKLELCELFLEHKANIRVRSVEEKSPLHLAALHGNERIVKLLVKEAFLEFGNPLIYIDAPDFEGNTALHLACQKGHKETAELLLSQGADMMDGLETFGESSAHSPLHLAAAYGHMDIVELLISHGAFVDSRDEWQRTPLQRAAEFDRVDTVKFLLENGADIDAKDNENRTAFVLAVKRGRTRTAEQLLDSGANFKSRDASLRTCLHLAVKHKREETLRMLLDRDQGQLINETDKDLQTPLFYAAHKGNLKILQLLIEKKCTVAPKDVMDRTPLHAAAEHGHVACVEVLCLAEQGHINDKDERGLTPLHLAALGSHRKTTVLLLHLGANPSIQDSNRWTALHHCASGGCPRTTQALLSYQSASAIDAGDQNGDTALHVAAKYGHVNVLELMLSRGADITARNKQMLTCLDVAISCNMENVAEVILGNPKWMSLFEYTVDRGANPLKNLIKSIPRLAQVVMDKCVTCSDDQRDDPDYSITFDFSILSGPGDKEDPRTSEGPRFFAPSYMVQYEREGLLMHPLSQVLLQWKWNTMGRPLFAINFLSYLAFVVLLSVFMIAERGKLRLFNPGAEDFQDDETDQLFRSRSGLSAGAPVLILIFICIHMIKEIYQIAIQKWRYLTHVTNYIEWCCYLCTICFVSPYLGRGNIFKGTMTMWPLASAVILLSYTTLILFLRRFYYVGIYISMLIEVTKTLFKVIIIFIPMLFAFNLTFFILLKEQATFRNLFWSFCKTFIMMIGEVDYGSIVVDAKAEINDESGAPLVHLPEFTAIIVCLFCMIVSVLVMNLLVGLAVGDIDSIQRNANMTRLAMQVEFVCDIDQRYPRWLRKYWHRSVLVLKPNGKNAFSFLLHINRRLFPMLENFINGQKESEVEEDEGTKKISMEITKQQEQIKFLQKTVEEQSRLLQEISHQLKQTAHSTATAEDTRL